ncbi:MAG TPA: geranylgeranylglyceryl/heptaprenylglyceryl phosphate synthase [Chitinophagales bacterium]|nr:geranylgeranylglyceryl/heptaprenylglyceryl phosphate synthase [Chitinophagales bacterium]
MHIINFTVSSFLNFEYLHSILCIMGIIENFVELRKRHRKALAVLIDPDKSGTHHLELITETAEKAGVDYFFAGGSMLVNDSFDSCVAFLKKHSTIPVVIFPGSRLQISPHADALLLLSLISGRNPELLIGQHVQAAPALRRSRLEIIPTGYILIDGGNLTSVNYVSQTLPIPACKHDIAVATAMAGEMLGMKLIYLEAGSGAKHPVSAEMISAVRENIHLPLIAGGGIRSAESAALSCKAGADVIVVGNGFEDAPSLIFEIASAIHETGKLKAQYG